MARPTIRLDPVGFWSYARDNEGLSEGRLGEILRQIKSELSARFGRLEIFQDTSAIRHGDEWEARIDEWIARSTFFIPVLTPHFIQSRWCLHEVERFLAREEELFATYPDLPRSNRIFPIHYVDIDDAPTPRPDLIERLTERNWFDMRELRYAERVDVGPVGRAIGDYAKSIRDLLMIQVDKPLSEEEVAEHQRREEAARAQETAAAEAARARKVEQKRATEEKRAAEARRVKEQERGPRPRPTIASTPDTAEATSSDEPTEPPRLLAGSGDGSTKTASPPKVLFLAGAVAALIGILSIGWTASRAPTAANIGSGLESAVENDAAGVTENLAGAASPAAPYAWLVGTWGLNGNCSRPMEIRWSAPRLVITYNGEIDDAVPTGDASPVDVGKRTFTYQGATRIDIVERIDGIDPVSYWIAPCGRSPAKM